MKIGKHFAALAFCLAVLWAGRFAPCGQATVSSWIGIVAMGGLLTVFLYLIAYDFVSLLTYRLGWEQCFDHLKVYPGDTPVPNARPISLKAKLFFFYPLDLAIVSFLLLPGWTKLAYCS
jgi:hypothetical protein